MTHQPYLADRLRSCTFTTIVAFGSSNTERRIPGMHWFDCFELACRNTFGPYTACINSGWGGHTTHDLIARIDRDCLRHRPELVFITIGGNDSNPDRNITAREFETNLLSIVQQLHASNARIVLQTYYAADIANIAPGHRTPFATCMDLIRKVARATDCMLIDHLARWENLRLRAYPVYRRLMLDGLHVNETGNLLLGVDIVRQFGLTLPDHPCFREALTLQSLLDEMAR